MLALDITCRICLSAYVFLTCLTTTTAPGQCDTVTPQPPAVHTSSHNLMLSAASTTETSPWLAGHCCSLSASAAGYVRTRMTDQQGLINVDESVSGMLAVLEGDKPLNGHWYAFDGKEIPW